MVVNEKNWSSTSTFVWCKNNDNDSPKLVVGISTWWRLPRETAGCHVLTGMTGNHSSHNLYYVHTLPNSFLWRHRRQSGIVWTATALGSTSRSHISNILLARLAQRAWCTKFHSSLLNIYFRLSGYQTAFLLIYFRDGPKKCSHCTKVSHKTYPICDAPLSRSARRIFAPSQKSRHCNNSCVWTEVLSEIVFVEGQKVSGIMWT